MRQLLLLAHGGQRFSSGMATTNSKIEDYPYFDGYPMVALIIMSEFI